jgi:hypothetical protein
LRAASRCGENWRIYCLQERADFDDQSGGFLTFIAEHWVGDQLAVVLLVRAVEAGFNEPLAQRIEIGHLELLEFAGEEFSP